MAGGAFFLEVDLEDEGVVAFEELPFFIFFLMEGIGSFKARSG